MLTLAEKVPTRLTMKQKEALKKEGKEAETDLNGNVIVPRYACVTSHTARRTGITNMYLSHKYTMLQMMHVSGHKTQKTFMDYIKLSSEEIADEIAAMSKKDIAKCGKKTRCHPTKWWHRLYLFLECRDVATKSTSALLRCKGNAFIRDDKIFNNSSGYFLDERKIRDKSFDLGSLST